MKDRKQKVYLIGIGLGTAATLTAEARDVINGCDCILGARRMAESITGIDKPVHFAYMTGEVKEFILAHQEYQKLAVLYAGDPGFYSGAKELNEALTGACEVEILPGISSVIYLAARLKVSWEDARLVSIHGRAQPYIHIIARHRKTFVLLGDTRRAEEFCTQMRQYDLQDIKIWLGRSLSYEAEEIRCISRAELKLEAITGLTVLYIENLHPLPVFCGGINDDQFIRGKVPMTKAEVRAISIAKLGLDKWSVLYDVGAGTGSVAITAATQLEGLRVYAVEKNPEGVELIERNQKKFCVDQVNVISGTAPEAPTNSEKPTHVFIGGSAGNLKAIIGCVKDKNPQVKIIINAITLETLNEVLAAERDGLLTDPEIVQVSTAKAKELSGYHMMQGQNPIYIISAG